MLKVDKTVHKFRKCYFMIDVAWGRKRDQRRFEDTSFVGWNSEIPVWKRKREGSKIDRVNSWRTIHPKVSLSVAPLVGPSHRRKVANWPQNRTTTGTCAPPVLSTSVRNDTNTRRVRRAKFRDKSYVRTFRFRSRRRYITCWTFLPGSYFTLDAGKKPTGQTAPARWTPTAA